VSAPPEKTYTMIKDNCGRLWHISFSSVNYISSDSSPTTSIKHQNPNRANLALAKNHGLTYFFLLLCTHFMLQKLTTKGFFLRQSGTSIKKQNRLAFISSNKACLLYILFLLSSKFLNLVISPVTLGSMYGVSDDKQSSTNKSIQGEKRRIVSNAHS
jgi:hypothetical protein